MPRTPVKRPAPRRRARGRKSRKRRFRLPGPKTWIAGACLAIVPTLACFVYLDVAVTRRFEGQLWQAPARIFSAPLSIVAGEPLTRQELEERLDRCGYAATVDRPTRPGQYRVRPAGIDVFARGFSAPAGDRPARRYRVEFRDGRAGSVRADDGSDRLLLEPELLATLHGDRQEEREVVSLHRIPESMLAAVLAAEDSRFDRHHGLDLRGIARASIANLSHGGIVQGGSTITQQTVKNLYLSQRRTWWRKLREAAMALILELRYTKARILEVYVNEIYLGQRGPVAICGLQAGSRFYFGRDLAQLSLAERAMLAGMIRSPGRYNPFRRPEAAIERRDQVLRAMHRLGKLDSEGLRNAMSEPLRLASGGGGFQHAPYAVDYIRARLARRYSKRLLRDGGLRIHTTLDTRSQLHAEAVLREGLNRLEDEVPALREQRARRRLQGASVVMDPGSGSIVAMVGGREYEQSQFNRASQARRQPGSCFKPFVFAAGFELALHDPARGLTVATILKDEPLSWTTGGKVWTPANYDRRYRGPVTVRRAVEESLNVPTARAARSIGLRRIVDMAQRSGIRSPLDEVPSLALGSVEVSPLELASAYGTFARGGVRIEPWIIEAVYDDAGKRIAGRRPETRRAMRAETAFLINDVLTGVVRRGTARSAARLGHRGLAAGKTGTTDDTRDAWFVGYGREALALVWVGYDDNATTGLTGARGALPIWVELMDRIAPPRGPSTFPVPAGIVTVAIDAETGARAGPRCTEITEERFARGTEPREPCYEHDGRFRRWFRRLRGPSSNDPV